LILKQKKAVPSSKPYEQLNTNTAHISEEPNPQSLTSLLARDSKIRNNVKELQEKESKK